MPQSTLQSSPSSRGPALPDAVVRAVRAVSIPFFHVQAARYALQHDGSSEELPPSLVMNTKTLLRRGEGRLDCRKVLPSVWSECYRTAFEELSDGEAMRLWGLVSTVLMILENGPADRVNASAAIVDWHNRFSNVPADSEEIMHRLQREDPRYADLEAVEELGSVVLGRIEDAFLTGRFANAASLMDALLLYLRRGGSTLLTAEVETALANVKRLLAVSFHDASSHQKWVAAADDELQESRVVLAMAARGARDSDDEYNSDDSAHASSIIDSLVEDLCAASADVLLLIKKDATLLCARCLDSHRSITDFIVAVCAIMEPFANLERVAMMYAEYLDRWDDETHSQWCDDLVLAILEVQSRGEMLEAMQATADYVAATYGPSVDDRSGDADGSSTGDNEDAVDDGADADVDSDTASISGITVTTAEPPSRALTRRVILQCMAAHVADLCAPAVVASKGEDIEATFWRNSMVESYVRLFALDSKLWRMAGLYVCYSPLIDPSLLYEIILAVAPAAAVDDSTYLSLRAFFHSTWSTSSDHQEAVRVKMEALLPGHATVSQWWSLVDHYYVECYRKVHQLLIVSHWSHGTATRAVWLSIETRLTDFIESEMRRLLQSKTALTNGALYAIGSAVQHGMIALDQCPSVELARYLGAAAAFAAYRQAATAVNAALTASMPGASSRGVSPASLFPPSSYTPSAILSCSCKAEVPLEAAAKCLQRIEIAVKRADECDIMMHPSTTFTMIEHGASLLLVLRQLMRDNRTGDSLMTSSHVSSTVLPLLVEAYELARMHAVHQDLSLVDRSRVLAEKLALVHQTSL